MKHTVIKPRTTWELFNFKDLWEFRSLFAVLFWRDVKLKYAQTMFGVLWVILQPLFISLMLAMIFGRMAHFQTHGVPYLPFTFAAMLPWYFFSQAVQRASTSIIGNNPLVTKVYFPRLLIPLSTICAVLIDLLVCFSVMVVILFIYHIPFTFNLLALPLVVLMSLLLSAGVGFLISALVVYYRDFNHILPFSLQIMMYLSPVMYAPSLIPAKWLSLYSLNPLVGIIETFRWSLLGLEVFPWDCFVKAIIGIFLILLLGLFVFKKTERFFADVI